MWRQESDQLDRVTSANGTLSYLVQLLAHLHFSACISMITQKVIKVSAGSFTIEIFFVVLRPKADYGLLILEVSRSDTSTHHSPFDSSGRVISPSQ
jgi:hypothetical protein